MSGSQPETETEIKIKLYFLVLKLMLNEIVRVQKGKKHISNIKEKIVLFVQQITFFFPFLKFFF